MNLFRSLFVYIVLLKLVVSNGEEMSNETGEHPHAEKNDKVPETSKTEGQKHTLGEPTKWTGSKPVPPTGNLWKSDIPESDKATQSTNKASVHMQDANQKPTQSTRDLSSGSSSGESSENHFKAFKDKNLPVRDPNNKKASRQNTDGDKVPSLEKNQNRNETSTRVDNKANNMNHPQGDPNLDIAHSIGSGKDNYSPPAYSSNSTLAVNQFKGKDDAEKLETHRTEKDSKLNTTGNNFNSSGTSSATTIPESNFTHISTMEKNGAIQKDKNDAGLKSEHASNSKDILHTTTAPSSSSYPTTISEYANISHSNSINSSQSSNKDLAGSPPHFTTTFFQPMNSTNEYENITDESKITMDTQNDGKIVVTDKTLTGKAITEEADVSNDAHETNPTENSSNSSSTPSPITPRGQMIMHSGETPPTSETGKKEKEKVPSSEKKTESTSESAKNSTLSTDRTTGTGVPPVNTTANNNYTTMTIQEFFSGLKAHTVLCIICILLVLITVLVIVSLLLVIYYFFKYTVIGLTSLCKRIGCCSKQKDKGLASIPEGSLFPRCDVSISPYVENPTFRNSNNRLSTDTY